MQDLTWSSILLGLVVTWGGAIALSFGLAVTAGLFAPGWLEDDSIRQRGGERMMTTPYLVASIVNGLICTAVGGFIAGGASIESWWSNAFVMGMLTLTGCCASKYRFMKINLEPLWYHVISIVLILPAALLGGWIRMFAW